MAVPARTPEPPALDVARIRQFARDRIPERLAAELRLDVEIDCANVTIVERRPPWNSEFGPDWSRSPITQLRFDAARSTWTIYWARASGRWQRYDFDPTPTVDSVLTELDADPDGVFWG